MKSHRLLRSGFLGLVALTLRLAAQEPAAPAPAQALSAALARVANLIEPPQGAPPQTFSARVKVLKADGLSKELVGREADVAFQAPDKLRLTAPIGSETYALGRLGQQLWIYAPGKQFGLRGKPGIPRFASVPETEPAKLDPIKLPIPREQIMLFSLLFQVEGGAAEKIDGEDCSVVVALPLPQAKEAFKIGEAQLRLWVRQTDSLPARLAYRDGKKLDVELEFLDLKLGETWPEDRWQPPAADGKIEEVALGHLTRFLSSVASILSQKIPTLGPATGERQVVATEGAGRLERVDDTRVLFLKGTPEEMGHQHGVLLKKQIRDMVHKLVYGVGVANSFAKGTWFFGEIEQAQARVEPFVDERYLREMDAIAAAAGLAAKEVRLSNFFPELFHCSGFALYGAATVDGRMYHGRILDYMRGVGLEQNAVIIVHQPDQGNAWVNVSYAGFVGSVTAMNEKHVAIGEMGGRGEGNWDGKPMAQLVREVMEKANTIDEAIEIMRRGPRTCEYYYVISDAKAKRAVGIAATPETFEVIEAGQSHPRLPHPFKDVVLMSAGDRYEKLAERVRNGYGKFDADSARRLMERPVAMTSNLHSVLFAPDTLDFWVANADSQNVASHTRYTHYNLAALLKPTAAEKKPTALAE